MKCFKCKKNISKKEILKEKYCTALGRVIGGKEDRPHYFHTKCFDEKKAIKKLYKGLDKPIWGDNQMKELLEELGEK